MIQRSTLIVTILAILLIKCADKIFDPVDFQIKRDATQLEKQLAQSGNKFGFNLFKEINKSDPKQNIFISPLSVSMALGMTLNGANGATFDAMKETLQLNGLSQVQINETYKSLIDLLSHLDAKVKFTLANSIWYRQEFAVENDFIDVNQSFFDALVQKLNFNDPLAPDTINQWVKDKTSGKIEKIVEQIKDEDVMFLINAIYFKGNWTYEFDKDLTTDDIFTKTDGSTVAVQMMKQEGEFDYFENQEFQAINLPYGDGDFSMMLILPTQENDLNAVMNQINESNWQDWQNSLIPENGTIQLPTFSMELKFSLKEILKMMGMSLAFEPLNADFSKINSDKDLFISDVLHKTFVEVNEEGTEAAAVTSVIIGVTSIGGGGFTMRIDRPFLFFIHENRSQTILFMGKVLNPVGNE